MIRRPPPSNNGNRNAATFLALLALMAAGLGLVFLTAMVLPQMAGILAVGVGFFFFGALHYMIWGWWMPSAPPDDDEENDAA